MDLISLRAKIKDLKSQRRFLILQIEELDSEIIGLQLTLEKFEARQRYQLEQAREKERNYKS